MTDTLSTSIKIGGKNITYQISSYKLLSNKKNDMIDLILSNKSLELLNKKTKNFGYFVVFINVINKNYLSSTKGIRIFNTLSNYSISDICEEDTNFTIGIPISLIHDAKILYYNFKLNFNYDLLNKDDPFYTSKCAIYDNDKKTDMSLSKRRQIMGNNTVDVCASNCEFQKYDENLENLFLKWI
jgi:hypothetical protein